MSADGGSAALLDVTVPSRPRELDGSGLAWTTWIPLERDAIRATAPRQPGVYRIRRCGRLDGRLVYVGQTGRGLCERLLALATGVDAAEAPYNDPHTAAPHLWLLRRWEHACFECSCAAVAGDVATLRGTEDMLLWRHRVELGCSTEANYGRFYAGYARSTNRWIVRGGALGTRTPGRRAEPLASTAGSVDYSVSQPALVGPGRPLEASWWQRASLAAFRLLPSGPAVYAIHDCRADEPVYVGETSALSSRAATHAVAVWPLQEPTIAYLPLPAGTPKHVLRELESDLLGWHFAVAGRAPALQYTKGWRDGDAA